MRTGRLSAGWITANAATAADTIGNRNYEEDSLHAGQIAVEVWVRNREVNRLNYLNAWQEYGDRESGARTKKRRK
jgi:hypothetical protein